MSVRERSVVYSAIAAPGQIFTHRTAARLLGLPVPGDERTEPLHVSVFLPDRAPRHPGVVGHHLVVDSIEVVTVDGLWVADAGSAIRQTASQVSVDSLVVMMDAALAGRTPLCTVERLHEQVRQNAGARGIAALREAAALARVGSESPQETRLRLLLTRAGLPEPQLNLDIHDEQGRFVARGDLVYPEQRVVVEYDGEQHRTSTGQYARDVDRLEDLTRLGWRVVRVLAAHMRSPELVVARVRAALGLIPS